MFIAGCSKNRRDTMAKIIPLHMYGYINGAVEDMNTQIQLFQEGFYYAKPKKKKKNTQKKIREKKPLRIKDFIGTKNMWKIKHIKTGNKQTNTYYYYGGREREKQRERNRTTSQSLRAINNNKYSSRKMALN